MDDNLENLISKLDNLNAYNPEKGLPDSIFYFVGRNTPFVNVDLLIKRDDVGTLLTWRDDIYTGKGWHIPGGIIRFKEKWENRIQEVARTELHIKIDSFQGPINVSQILSDLTERSHFISLLFECNISDKCLISLKEQVKKNPHKINFFKIAPKNLLDFHRIYQDFI